MRCRAAMPRTKKQDAGDTVAVEAAAVDAHERAGQCRRTGYRAGVQHGHRHLARRWRVAEARVHRGPDWCTRATCWRRSIRARSRRRSSRRRPPRPRMRRSSRARGRTWSATAARAAEPGEPADARRAEGDGRRARSAGQGRPGQHRQRPHPANYTTITSPIEGRTGIRQVDPGNNVHATDTTGIVVVTQVQPIAVIFTLPEEDLPRINERDRRRARCRWPRVRVMAETRARSAARCTLVDNQIDQATGTIRAEGDLPEQEQQLWPGQFVNARVLVRTEQTR